MSSVLITLRKTVQSDLPKGMETRLPLPSDSLSKRTSERKMRIFETSTSLIRASKERSTACMASMASANTDCPYGDMSTRVLSMAGFTMAKVGKEHPVS